MSFVNMRFSDEIINAFPEDELNVETVAQEQVVYFENLIFRLGNGFFFFFWFFVGRKIFLLVTLTLVFVRHCKYVR